MRKARIVMLAVGIVLMASFCAWGDVVIDETTFPDDVFRAYVSSDIDTNPHDGTLSDGEISAVTAITVSRMGIASLKGVEYFTALTTLDCSYNQLTTLDVSGLANLAVLYCYSNQLTTLDLSNNTALTRLNCSYNQLTTLDVSGLANLATLSCSSNQLTTLDLSGCDSLEYLDCNGNQLTSLDVSGCSALEYLTCYNNQLTTLDVSGLANLATLRCYSNQLTTLDLSNNTALTRLECSSNQLTSLDVSGCSALEYLDCNNNQLTTLDLSNNAALTELQCYSNQLTTLDVSGCSALTTLYCYINQLTTLDVSGLANLATLRCYSNQLTTLDLSGCDSLEYLDCNGNQLTSLDVSGCSALEYLDCNNNQLTTLDLSNNAALTELQCYSNQLTTLDVSNNTALTGLYCPSQTPTLSLDVTSSTGYTHKLTFAALSVDASTFKTRARNLSADNDSFDTISITSDDTAIYFSSQPTLMTYDYYTGSADLTMPVTVTFNAASSSGVAVNETNFPDSAFRAYVSSDIDTDNDGYLSASELSADKAQHMVINNMGISSLKGIEYFTNLRILSCGSNDLTELDVSANSKLVSLDFWSNSISAIDISSNSNLQEIHAYNNSLTTIDTSHNTALRVIDITTNELSAIDVSANSNLVHLNVYGNNIASLNVKSNPNLTYLSFGANQVASIDLSSNPLLEYLGCNDNCLAVLDLSHTPNLKTIYADSQTISLTSPDAVSGMGSYTYSVNLVDALNITQGLGSFMDSADSFAVSDYNGGNVNYSADVASGIMYFAGKPKTITYNFDTGFVSSDGKIYADVTVTLAGGADSGGSTGSIAINSTNFPDSAFRAYVQASIDQTVSGYLSDTDLAAVTTLDLSERGIADLTGIEHFTGLTSLNCYSNDLTGTLDLSKNTALTYLDVSYNELTSLDVSGCDSLENLYCHNNQLTSLDVSNNTALTTLNCSSNQLTALDVSNNSALVNLIFDYNQVSAIDLSNNKELKYLSCQWNNVLSELDVSSNTSLTNITCGGNSLTALDVSKNLALTSLLCWSNQLTSLDVSKNTALEHIDCGNNQLTALDLSNNAALTELQCYSNQLTALNITSNTKLVDLRCEENKISSLNLSSNPELMRLVCYSNNLMELDVSSNTKLVVLNCYSNDLPILDLSVNSLLDSDDLYLTSRINNHFPNDVGQPLRTSRFTSQTIALPKPQASGGTTDYPYTLNLSTIAASYDVTFNFADFTAHAYSFDITDSSGSTVNYSADVSSGIVYFSSMPAKITYLYDTQYSGYTSPAPSMDVTVDFNALTIALAPATQTITAGNSISPITYTVSNSTGTLSFDVTALPDGITQSGSTFSGSISSAGTYSFTVTVMDTETSETASATATIIVNSPSSSSPSSDPSTPSTPSIPSEVSPDVSPDVTPTVSPDISIDVTPIVSPDVSPDISPDITPTESTDVTPAESTDITPTDSQDVTPTPGPDPYNPGGDEQNDGDSPSSAYSLTSAAQIINLINRLLNGLEAGGKYYIINADLDFSDVTDWQPIGSAAHPFSGHFNGGGHTITYNGGGGGLFGVVSSDGTAIQDLNVVVSRTRNGSALDKGASPAPTDYAGGIVQELVSGVIDGCTFSGPVSASGENTSAGGIVGELSGGTVQNCKVLDGSTIRATLSAGGIAGYVSEGRISGCTSDAEVDAEYSGGIAGYSETERGNISNNDFSKADLEVGNDEVLHLTLTLTPISQSVTAGSPITPITFRVSNAAHVSMDVPNVPDSLTLSGDVFKGVTISGTIQTAGTYSFTVTFTDQDTNETVSSDVTIIVRPAGITGITITSPDTKTIKLGQEGGSFSAEILAEGKAYGLVVWNAARTPGVSADISGSGMTATLTGTAEPNPDSQDRTITLTITAHDDGGRDFSDTLSVIVQGRRGPHSVPHYAFDVPEGVRSRLISLWGGEFYQFTAGEILSENWELSSSDLQILSGLGEKVLVHLPSVRPNNSGAYLLKLTLGSDVEVGAALKLYGITSGTGGNVSAGALEEQDYILLDEDGNEIDTVPESRTVYVALRLTAGRNHRSVITTPVQLSRGTIQPIEPDETLLEKIAETMNVSADQINFITEDEISDPEEPTQEMLEEVSNQNYSIIGKLNKLTVNKTGYYVFKVTLSDDLYEQIKNVRVEDLRVYSLYDENESSDIRVGASFIGGLVNTWELLTLGGEKMEFGLKEFLMVGLLDAGKGVCMYLGKILLTLLLAGCDTGLGIAGLIAVGLSAVFFASRRKR